jgi:transcriptional regulator with XRE-family HTH domain
MELKDKILELLDRKNLTIKDLAEKIGMSETGFHSTLKNNTFKFETIIKISQILGVNVLYFTEEKSNLNLDLKVELQKMMSEVTEEAQKSDSFKHFSKVLELSKDIHRKAGGQKISNSISNVSDFYEFLDEYYRLYYYSHLKAINEVIEKAVIEKKGRTTILKEIVPYMTEVFNNPRLDPKPLIKLEKAFKTFFNEVSQYVSEEDEGLNETVQDLKDIM